MTGIRPDRRTALATLLVVAAVAAFGAAAAAAAMQATPSSATLRWAGLIDRVGTGSTATPDGAPDGHFVLTIRPSGPVRVTEITLRTADGAGRPCCGQLWNTTPDGNWILGVDRGSLRLNPTDRPISASVATPTVFHLYGSSSGYFTPGQRFLVTVRLAHAPTLSAMGVVR